MSLHPLPAAEAIPRLSEFTQIIDARSEGEFAEDHLPGAVNWPSLSNEERIRVGTLYKQVSPFEAQKIGARPSPASAPRSGSRAPASATPTARSAASCSSAPPVQAKPACCRRWP